MWNNYVAIGLLVGLLSPLQSFAKNEAEPFLFTSKGTSHSVQGVRTNLREKTTAEKFIRENYDEIKVEAAKGHGDHLQVASTMLIDSKAERKRFKKALKKKHKTIFKHDADKGTAKILALAKKYQG